MVNHLEHALEDARGWEERCLERDRLGRIFIGNLAHELRTALTPISGYLKILSSDKLGPLSAQQQRILDSIQGAAGRLTRVVENLSDFATLQATDAALFPAGVDAGRARRGGGRPTSARPSARPGCTWPCRSPVAPRSPPIPASSGRRSPTWWATR